MPDKPPILIQTVVTSEDVRVLIAACAFYLDFLAGLRNPPEKIEIERELVTIRLAWLDKLATRLSGQET